MKPNRFHVIPSKTHGGIGKRAIIEWLPELPDAVAIAKTVRRVDISLWSLYTRKDDGYFHEGDGQRLGSNLATIYGADPGQDQR